MIDSPSTNQPRKRTLQQLTDHVDLIRHLVAQMPSVPFETRLSLNCEAQRNLSILNSDIVNHFRALLISIMHVRHNLEPQISLN